MYRRDFLKTLALGSVALSPLGHAWSNSATQTSELVIGKRTLDVNGKAASVFGLTDKAGNAGLVLNAPSDFDVLLRNESDEETLIHWHGLTPPWELDGVPGNPAALLPPKESRAYNFPLPRGGTHWMHAHTLQEQNLLAAPLIIRTAEDLARDEQEVIVLLHDFSFKSPEELLSDLQSGGGHAMPSGHGDMSSMMKMHGGHQMGSAETSASPQMMMGMDLNDIEYDAYLANDRTLDDPEIVKVERGGRVRLRIINGATATAFTIDTGELEGELIAVDGMDIVPVRDRQFPLSMGQRADIRLALPLGDGAYPILALREGALQRTGVILATASARVQKLETTAAASGPVLDLSLEQSLHGLTPLARRAIDRQFALMLGGDMATYRWSIDTDSPIEVSSGQRIRISMHNMSMMAHPMHLHGHHFQVTEINGKNMSGAMRDTVMLPPMAQVSIEFDADNPGRWPLHCHHLYHMATGMMTFVDYVQRG